MTRLFAWIRNLFSSDENITDLEKYILSRHPRSLIDVERLTEHYYTNYQPRKGWYV